MLKKRGQLTVFIIIGLLLLVILGVLIYMRQQRTEVNVPEYIPEKLVPIKTYTEECIKKTATEAIITLGMQGGYIYLPERIFYDPTSYVLVGGAKVPYWYYQGRSRVPTVEGMQDEISRYINENLDRCLIGYDQFKDYEITFGNKSSRAYIEKGVVNVKTNMTMDIREISTGALDQLTKFSVDIEVELLKMFTLAKEMMASENSNMYFEDVTIDLMAASNDIPFTDVLFQCSKKYWYVPEVKERIKNLLFYNLPKIRVRGTDAQPFLEHYSKYELLKGYTAEDIGNNIKPKAKDIPEDAYDYFHFQWFVPRSDDYSGLRAQVHYQKDWDFVLNVRPSKGDIMSASYGKGSAQYYLSFLCINAYHFTYDVIYPLEVAITDEKAFGQKGFSFRFAFPVMINHNQGDRNNFALTSYEFPDYSGGEYCDSRAEKETLIYAKNKKTLDDIPNANITFNCMNIYECDLGKTSEEYGTYRLATRLPTFCSPPQIVAQHTSYAKTTKMLEPDATYADIMMIPLKTLKFKVVKQRLTAEDLQRQEELEPGESAIVYLSTDKAEDFDIYRKYPFDNETTNDFKMVKMLDYDATYRLEVILLSKDDKIIGGFRGNWTVDDATLSGKSTLVFKAIEKIPHPTNVDEQGNVVMLLEDGKYNQYLMPYFS